MRTPRPVLAALVTAVLATLTACTGSDVEGANPVAPSTSVVTGERTPPPPAPTPTVSVPVAPATPAPVQPAAPAPQSLRAADLGIDMPILPTGVQPDGAMEIPEEPAVAGWYRWGRAPGDAEGSTVIAAHVDDRILGIGPLATVRDAQPGQVVEVVDEAGTAHSYVTESVTYIERAQLPVADLFTRTGPRTLVIITCGGPFDEATRSYRDNVVLVARALP